MRKSFVAILLLVLIVGLFLFLKRPGSPDTSTANGTTAPRAAVGEGGTNPGSDPAKPRWTKPTRNEASRDEAPVSKAIVYTASDFARGELQNIVVDNGIRLGNDASFVPRFNPNFKLFGNFVSPETDASKPFDALNLNLQASALGGNEVIFEVRTRSSTGDWSEWREVSPENMKEPIPAQSPQSTGWQFRVGLFANDAAGSPKVDTVSIEPIATGKQDFSANNNTQ